VRDQRLAGLEARDLRLERVDLVGLYVRGVRDDEVERPLEAGDELARHELDAVLEPGSGPVHLRDGERARRVVRRHDLRSGMLVGDRERDRAGADPDVEHAGLCRVREQLEAALDDRLRLRPGDQHARIDTER
jgi:hypothetical protein